MKKWIVLFLLTTNVSAMEPNQCPKTIVGDIGRAVGGAIVGEVVHEIADRMRTPDNRPTPPERHDPPRDRPDNRGSDPAPVGHPEPRS